MPRLLALDLLDQVLGKHVSFDEAFDRHPRTARLEVRDRAFAYTLVATVLRRLGQLDAVIASCLERPLPKAKLRAQNLLRLGAVQLVFLQTPPHAAVDTSVELATGQELATFRKLINAVLHRLVRDGAALVAGQDAARLNTPDWLWQSWVAAYGVDTTRAIAEAHLDQAPVDLAVKADPSLWAERLGATVLPTGALRLNESALIPALEGYGEGAWWVQDQAAQLPAQLLGDVRGLRIADLGAAPGGKTAQLVSAGAQVIAVDRSPARLETLRGNLARLQLAAEIVEADAQDWRPAEKLDAVLLDAPCSATGTIRRHPDILRLRRPGDISRAANQQMALLRASLDMVKTGGTIVFATCSLQPDEGPKLVAKLLRSGLGVTRRPIDSPELAPFVDSQGDLRTLPSQGMDGFYAARLVVNS